MRGRDEQQQENGKRGYRIRFNLGAELSAINCLHYFEVPVSPHTDVDVVSRRDKSWVGSSSYAPTSPQFAFNGRESSILSALTPTLVGLA